LRQREFFARAETGDIDRFETALQRFGRKDLPDLYATGSAWLGWITSNPDSMAALAELPMAMAVMRRCLELDDAYADGGIHLLFGIYYASQPPGAGQDLPRSKQHFERAMAIPGEHSLLPVVLYAEIYAPMDPDEQLCRRLLEGVLEKAEHVSCADPDARDPNALTNAVAVERARRLLAEMEEYSQ